jgi:transcriptional regulator with GAF, ATPase, and Fis domain
MWRVELESGHRYTIGRESSSDIVLDYPWVSQRHAVIIGGEPPKVVDLGSRNGTSVDSHPVIPGTPRVLASGSVIDVAGVSLLVQRGPEPDAAAWRRVGPPSQLSARSAFHSGNSGVVPVTLVTRDPQMRELSEFVEKIAPSDVSVLILGETGVGKELFARSIHERSARAKKALVVLNCAAIPENLVESELFGYERGAFSGAVSPKPGLFEAAHGSTLFLDEVGELPISIQAKLLRVLETGEVLRLGSLRPKQVDVRLVAATNRDLGAAIADGSFRLDLFYRLNGISIAIPALRERRDDIALLAEHFAETLLGPGAARITVEARVALENYAWPGNVRELKSTIQRAALLAPGGVIDADQVQFAKAPSPGPVTEIAQSPSPITVDTDERRRIQDALDRVGGNQTDAAKLLGISRRTLIKRLDRYGLARPRKRPAGCNESGERPATIQEAAVPSSAPNTRRSSS